MDVLVEFLPFLIPLIIIEWILAITALIHVLRHPHYKFGNKSFWIVVVLFVQIIGPIVYFIFGRGEE
ncbi:PLDc_N domain-containing protein [Drancourtella massiliensis]|uniref:PLDc_N domain-containing protein n=1 Tax=Drancourtella massiliensis TaxID=1632013 RepID=A0ABS2EK32_9FIRM|nr:PLD nuclease N-terminal domain-containing protein [Drancourtella massiliensis]MBM6745326.1 PLDc_N domain-containing protein [Drancourtella massiliensis]